MADHPFRSATRLSLGEPLPHQLANRPRAPPPAHCCFPLSGLCGISPGFPRLFPTRGRITHVLLTRTPLYSRGCPRFLVRLACVRRAASVDSEPGSNSRLNRSSISSPRLKPVLRRVHALRPTRCQRSARPARGSLRKPGAPPASKAVLSVLSPLPSGGTSQAEACAALARGQPQLKSLGTLKELREGLLPAAAHSDGHHGRSSSVIAVY